MGSATATADAEGEIIRRSDPTALSRAQLEAVLPAFTGEILQRPPMYSALKRDGKPLYELARAGIEVEREARPVRIHALHLTAFEAGAFALDVRCSKGTYVRTLVEDLAVAVGQCAHVASLRRVEAGPFGEADMVSASALEQAAGEGDAALGALLLPPLAGLASWPRVLVDEGSARRLASGQAVQAVPGATGLVAVTGAAGGLLGIAEQTGDGRLTPRRWMAEGS